MQQRVLLIFGLLIVVQEPKCFEDAFSQHRSSAPLIWIETQASACLVAVSCPTSTCCSASCLSFAHLTAFLADPLLRPIVQKCVCATGARFACAGDGQALERACPPPFFENINEALDKTAQHYTQRRIKHRVGPCVGHPRAASMSCKRSRSICMAHGSAISSCPASTCMLMCHAMVHHGPTQ